MVCKFDIKENNLFAVFNYVFSYLIADSWMFHNMIIPYFYYVCHISNSALCFAKYSSTRLIHRRNLDYFDIKIRYILWVYGMISSRCIYHNLPDTLISTAVLNLSLNYTERQLNQLKKLGELLIIRLNDTRRESPCVTDQYLMHRLQGSSVVC